MINDSQIPDVAKELELKVQEWTTKTATGAEADRLTALEMADVKSQQSRGKFLMADPEMLSAYEGSFRQQYDDTLRKQLLDFEIEHTQLSTQVHDAITAAEVLKPAADQHVTNQQNYLLASILDKLSGSEVRAGIHGLTRAQLLERYTAWSDTDDTAHVRIVEQAVVRGELELLGVQGMEDRIEEAVVIKQLIDAVNARRRARVPAALLEAQQRLQTMFKGLAFSMTKDLLRRGHGVANRPYVERAS